jgi:hypothetical protein
MQTIHFRKVCVLFATPFTKFSADFEPFAPKEEFDLLSIHINQHNYELSVIEKQSYRFASKSFYIHCFPRNKMLDPPYNLRWTTIKVGTIMVCFALTSLIPFDIPGIVYMYFVGSVSTGVCLNQQL